MLDKLIKDHNSLLYGINRDVLFINSEGRKILVVFDDTKEKHKIKRF